jgi:hypothetical protein
MSDTLKKSRGLLAVASVVALAGLVGCNTSPSAKRDAQVRSDLTPELQTLSQRPIDVDNTQAVVWDEDLRMANEDWDRFWLMDRPSRLSRWRMPH